jgi:hypothetical protein
MVRWNPSRRSIVWGCWELKGKLRIKGFRKVKPGALSAAAEVYEEK